jgi:hypothetical protein
VRNGIHDQGMNVHTNMGRVAEKVPELMPVVEAAPEPLPPTEVITEQMPVVAKETEDKEICC